MGNREKECRVAQSVRSARMGARAAARVAGTTDAIKAATVRDTVARPNATGTANSGASAARRSNKGNENMPQRDLPPAQHDGVNEGEDGGGAADAEGERQDGDGGEPARRPQLPQRVDDVAE